MVNSTTMNPAEQVPADTVDKEDAESFGRIPRSAAVGHMLDLFKI